MAPGPDTKRWATAFGVGAGLVAAVVALGVAELVAGLMPGWKSPVLDVGDRVVDTVPPAVKDFAIDQFGTNDKLALLVGIGVLLGLYAAVVGALVSRRRIGIGVAGIAAFGIIGAYAALTRRADGSWDDVVPSLAGTLAGGASLWASHRSVRSVVTARAPETSGDAVPTKVDRKRAGLPRRQVLVQGGRVLALLALAGAGAGAVGRSLKSRFSASQSRAAVRLPAPAEPLAAVPDAVSLDVPGISPFITPNADFYRIDTALAVPQLPTEEYELRVTGMVDRELRLSFEDLLAREVVEHDITLTCVSNTVGGDLVGNARWLGVRLDDLLAEAGVRPGADQVVGRSVDGYTCGFPLEAATDGRNAMVAFGMNGEPLPLEHGFPARLVVPGLYGYVSATKWLVEIEVTTFATFDQYWVPRGYAARAPIKLMSRIDSVDGLGTLRRGVDGRVAVGGVAWAQTRGISAVEVQVDGGAWVPAELGAALNADTWRQWAHRWTPTTTGRSTIRCRAIDASGVIQPDARSEPVPDGASGHHQIVVFIE